MITLLVINNQLEKIQYQACLEITGAFKVHHVRVFTWNLDLNLYKVGGGIGK